MEPEVRTSMRAWWVAAATMAALVAAAAFRSSTGALLEPIEEEFGWSRGTTSGAVSLNLIIYGLTAPFAAAVMERFGIRRVVAIALTMVAAGAGLTLVMREPWQLWFLWGVPVGVGTGVMALVFGAIVANRWFVRHRGLVTGIFSAGSATGQLLFLPVIAVLASGPGWRWAAALVAVFALVLVPVALLALHDRPSDVGEVPYGAPESYVEPVVDHSGPGPAAVAVSTLRQVSRSWTFWALFLTFWICGWSTNGLIGTHFIPAAHDHGMPATTSAGLLALIGVFDIVGTIASGWLTDRVDSRYLLFGYYFLRGLSLLVVPALLGPQRAPEPLPVHRVLRTRLGGDRASYRGAVPDPLRPGEVGRGVRLGVRRAHGGRRGRGVVRRLDPRGHGRLLPGLDDGGWALRARRGDVPVHPEGGRAAWALARGGVRGVCSDLTSGQAPAQVGLTPESTLVARPALRGDGGQELLGVGAGGWGRRDVAAHLGDHVGDQQLPRGAG